MKKNKKAQIEMGETVAVLIIFFVLLVLTFTYFMFIKAGEAQELLAEKEAKQSIRIAQESTFLAELACTHEGVVRNQCLDYYKLNAFGPVRDQANLLYFDRLGYSKVRVVQTYPNEQSWEIYNTRDPDRSATYVTQIPVSILTIDSLGVENFNFGYLEVTYYYAPV